MTTLAGEICYYIDRYTDEVLPCSPTLEGWASWLSKPSEQWRRPEAAKDGEAFDASVIEFVEDLVITRTDEGWSFSREPEGATLLAVRYEQGGGWDSDSIVGDFDALKDYLSEYGENLSDRERVAVGIDRAPVRLIYRVDPPRLEIAGTIQ